MTTLYLVFKIISSVLYPSSYTHTLLFLVFVLLFFFNEIFIPVFTLLFLVMFLFYVTAVLTTLTRNITLSWYAIQSTGYLFSWVLLPIQFFQLFSSIFYLCFLLLFFSTMQFNNSRDTRSPLCDPCFCFKHQ